MLSEATRWEVFERDDFRCACCGSRQRLTVDHITPRALGGGDTPDNLRTLCRPCNSSKGTNAECIRHSPRAVRRRPPRPPKTDIRPEVERYAVYPTAPCAPPDYVYLWHTSPIVLRSGVGWGFTAHLPDGITAVC